MTKDGTEEQQNSSVATQDASKGKQGTSKETPETFTREARDKAVQDALSVAGRTAKAFEAREQRVKDSEAKAVLKQKERDDAELEAAKDDPAELTLVQRRQQVKARELASEAKERDITAREVIAQEKEDAAKATQFEIKVFDIATKYELKPDMLKELGITDIDQLEKVAKVLSTKVATGPDPGGTIGGGVSDADFLENFGNGSIPYTKDNAERAKKLMK